MKIKGSFPVRWAAQDGKPGTGVTIVTQTTRYAVGTSGTTHPSSGWQTSVPSVTDGQYLWTWVYVRYSDGTETNSYSVARQGIDGKGIKNSIITYSQQKDSVDPATITNWGAFPSTLTDGYWLYTKTHIVYSDEQSTDSYSVSQVGVGSYYAGCQEYWSIGDSDSIPPDGAANEGTYVNGQTITTSWSQDRVKPTAANPYLWNFEISADSRGNKYVTQAICIGNFAKGIASIVETYAISAYGSPDNGGQYPSDIAAADWQDEQHAAAPTEAKRYQWNRTVVTYNDGSPDTHYHVSAVKGIDGKGTVYIDLDNENDSMLFDGNGDNIVGTVTSNISLYDNGAKVSIPPTFSVLDKSTFLTATINNTTRVLTVSTNGFYASSASSGYVIVQCIYNGVVYTARMTVLKIVGTDKYEIVLTHSSITYNITKETLSKASTNVYIYRTAQNGIRTQVSNLSTYGLTLKVYPNGSAVNALTPSYSNYATVNIDSSWDNFAVVLLKGSQTIDRETVPINKVEDGNEGPGAVFLDLDNENDSILYDGADSPISDAVVSTGSLYNGTSKVTSGITWSISSVEGVTLMNNGAATSTNYARSSYPTAAWINSSGLVTVNGLTASQAKIVVNANYGNNDYKATLTIKKLRGVDKYDLILNPAAVTYNSTTQQVNGASSATVTVELWRTGQNGDRTKISDFNGTNKYGLSIELSPSLTLTKNAAGGTFSVSTSTAINYSNIQVTLKRGDKTEDSDGLPIAKTENGSGTAGPAAKSIYANAFDQPATPKGSTPWTASGSIWSENSVEDTLIPIKHQGDWIKEEDGYMRAPAIGSNQSTTQTIMFITTESNQVIHLRAKCSTSSYARMYIGKVDNTAPTASGNYERSISGTSQDTGDIAITVANAGQHFICICYTRGGNYTEDKYAKFIIGQRPIWRSDAKTYNSVGAIATWSTPVKMSGSCSDEAPQMRANLILQSSFLATRMDQWVTKNGVTTNGLDGRNGYNGVPDYTTAYKELLAQNMYEPNSDQRLLANTWYTLSFWAKADPYIQIDKYETSENYGFARVQPIYFKAGVQNTIWVNGYVSSAAFNANKSLRVFVYGDGENEGWGSTIAIVKITATSSTTASATFTVPTTGWYYIQAYVYLEPSGGNSAVSGHTATVNWYRIDRGMRLMTFLYPTGGTQTTYTAIDTTAGRIKDGEFITGTSTDNNAEWLLSEVWTRHTLTFKTRSSIPSSIQQLLIRMHQASNGVYVCMPKLEQGTIATAFCTNDNDVVDMAADETGFPNDRNIWVESPEDPYVWNETHRDYVAHEIDGTWYRFFVKRKGMTVPNGVAPTAGGNSYWEQGNVVSTLLSNTIIGTNCNLGGFLASNQVFKSQNGRLVINGLLGIIQMYHEYGYSWQVLEDGRQVIGSYTSDTDKGQHIQIDPSTKEIRIYDESGSCVTRINGEAISTIADLFGNTSGSLTLNSYKTGSYSASNGETKTIDNITTATNNVCDFQTTSATRLKFNGSLSATGSRTWVQVGSVSISTDNPSQNFPSQGIVDHGQYSIDNLSKVEVRIKTYSDSARTVLMTTKTVAIANSQRSTSGYDTHSVTMNNLSVDLSAGYHTLEVYYYCIVYRGQTSTTSVSCQWNITSVSFVSDTYISRLFANGMAYGTSLNNFFAAMNVANKMHVKAQSLSSGNVLNGFELSAAGLSIIHAEKLLKPVVTLGWGRITCNGTSSSTSDTVESFANAIRGDPDSVTVTRTANGIHMIKYPASWTSLGLTASRIIVHIDSYLYSSSHSGRSGIASVGTITSTYCTFAVGDDNSPSDAWDAYFEIKYMLP